jgi:hypothetical protein
MMLKCIEDMPGSDANTQKFIQAFADKLIDSAAHISFDAEFIATTCHLLQTLDSQHASTRSLSYALAKVFPKSEADFNASHIAS